jgi:hypothetical protein
MKVEFANRILVNGNEERMSDSNKPTRFSKLLELLLALAGLAVIAINVVLLRQQVQRVPAKLYERGEGLSW